MLTRTRSLQWARLKPEARRACHVRHGHELSVLDGLDALLIVEPRGHWPLVWQLGRGVLFAYGLHYRLADLLAQRAEMLHPILWVGLRTASGVGRPERGALCANLIVPEPLLPERGLARLFVASGLALLAALDKRHIGVVGGALDIDILEVIDLITACDLSPHLLLDFCVTRAELQGRQQVGARRA